MSVELTNSMVVRLLIKSTSNVEQSGIREKTDYSFSNFDFSFGNGLIVLSIYSIIIYQLTYYVYIIQIKKGY